MEESVSNPNLYLLDKKCAIIQCQNEFMDILTWLFGGCHRQLEFYMKYDLNMEPFTPLFTKDYSDVDFVGNRNPNGCYVVTLMDIISRRFKREHEHGIPINLFNYFGNEGGFKAISDLLDPVRLAELSGVLGARLPLEMFIQFIAPFRNTLHYISPQFAADIVPTFKQIFITQLAQFGEKEIKNMDKDLPFKYLEKMAEFLDLYYENEEKCKIIELHQMLIAVKYLACPYLEKRLRGIAEINKMIAQVNHSKYPS